MSGVRKLIGHAAEMIAGVGAETGRHLALYLGMASLCLHRVIRLFEIIVLLLTLFDPAFLVL